MTSVDNAPIALLSVVEGKDSIFIAEMKKIALYILCGVMALFTSCDPSLLDLQNENTLSTGIYWKTESDIEAGVIAVYGMFYRQGTWTRNIYTQMIGMADIAGVGAGIE